ncbi:class I SAM-dependent methyltransferase, partial [Ralstonia solanacearum]
MNTTTTVVHHLRPADTERALRILRRLLAGMEKPPALRLWAESQHGHDAEADFTLVVRDPGLLRQLVIGGDPILLADAYFRGALDVEGDLYSALRLRDHFESITLSWRDKLALWMDALKLPAVGAGEVKPNTGFASRVARRFAHRHSRRSDRAAISFHYDVSNEFYGLWLDDERVYSCAYFEQPTDSLDTAQRNKLEHICRKLRLSPGERL